VHSVTGRGASSNAFPVWTDEWRSDTGTVEVREAYKQLLRNAWNANTSSKGGSNRENVSELRPLPASAPLITTGEDSFYETSHIDRILLIDMPKDGKNAAALEEFDKLSVVGFGRDYLTWILDNIDADNEWMVHLTPPHVYDRQRHGREIARWGYGMFEQFLIACDLDVESFLPQYDDSLVKTGQDTSSALRPIDEAIALTLRMMDRDDRLISWEQEGETWTRPLALAKWAKEHDTTLAGGSRSVATWLRTEYGATMNRHPDWGDAWHWPTPAA
jgi:hypothetical protein